jgi:activator of 2-hydroxyglutaryl-CoA dehydratase
MIVAGCDVGSLTAKAVIMDDDNIISHAVMLAKTRPAESAKEVMEKALKKVDMSGNEIQ